VFDEEAFPHGVEGLLYAPNGASCGERAGASGRAVAYRAWDDIMEHLFGSGT